jgi:hypothetical protein
MKFPVSQPRPATGCGPGFEGVTPMRLEDGNRQGEAHGGTRPFRTPFHGGPLGPAWQLEPYISRRRYAERPQRIAEFARAGFAPAS